MTKTFRENATLVKKILFVWVTVVLVVSLLLPGTVTYAQDASDSDPTPESKLIVPPNGKLLNDRYIVVYKEGISARVAASTLQRSTTAKGAVIDTVFSTVLNGYSAYLPDQVLQKVLEDPNVAYVAADAILTIEGAQNSQQVGSPWGLDRIDQHVLPLNSRYTYINNGTGVNAYVIDTGIYTANQDFGGRARNVYDAIGDGQNGNDCNGHGTHVAGIVGGSKFGVAKGARLLGVRVFDCGGSGSYSDVIAGIDWVAAHGVKPAVVNLSLSGWEFDPLDTAVNKLIAKGFIVVVAAGNSSDDACYYSPAKVPNAITVAATNASDAQADYSNYGSCVDLFAPGSDILSDSIGSASAVETLSGTSMAAPHVSGVVALYLQKYPKATLSTVRAALMSVASNKVLTDVSGGTPNKLLFSMITGGEYKTPLQVYPIGTLTGSKPVYKWSKVKDASRYEIQLYTQAGKLVGKYTVLARNCSGYYCTFTQPTALGSNSYKWRIRSRVGSNWYPISNYVSFNRVQEKLGFISTFDENYTDWSFVQGDWQLADASVLLSNGTMDDSDSIVHSGDYPNVDFTVRMKRLGSYSDANRIIIYGRPDPLTDGSTWYQGLMLEYTNDQMFRVLKMVKGVETVLIDWTYADWIVPFDYNDVRIVSKSGVQKFYFNGSLVAAGKDTSLSTGQVGIGMTQTDSSSPLSVDSAYLLTTIPIVTLQALPTGVVEYGIEISEGTTSIDQSPGQ
ncbi:MAG: S8 family peptidase [Anaerolineaceae bacterium]|nr:S8 family peptidase [Anaerolineaceae bacterium]